jgi:hypothetical protein
MFRRWLFSRASYRDSFIEINNLSVPTSAAAGAKEEQDEEEPGQCVRESQIRNSRIHAFL